MFKISLFSRNWSRKAKSQHQAAAHFRGLIPFTLILLFIEFFDELSYAVDSAVLPALRLDLHLDYAQVGLLLGLPHLINIFIEPGLMLLGDTRLRKRIILGGGLILIVCLLLLGSARAFPPVLLAFILAYPASGAFVTLSQAALMEANPGRESQWMARWTLAGSVGNLAGPLIVAGGFVLGFGWRWAFYTLAGMALLLVLAARVYPFSLIIPEKDQDTEFKPANPGGILYELRKAIRSPFLIRWLILLVLSDLLLDVFFSYVPLYFTDVVGATPAQASVALGILTAASLAADAAAIPLLERFSGRKLVRLGAAASLLVYPLLLLAPSPALKIFMLVLIRFTTLGWYPVLQGEAYAAFPGRPGTVAALASLGGVASGGMLWLLGWIAQTAGLPAAMWVLLLGPLGLALFVPPARK